MSRCICAMFAVVADVGSVSEDLQFVDGAVDIQRIVML